MNEAGESVLVQARHPTRRSVWPSQTSASADRVPRVQVLILSVMPSGEQRTKPGDEQAYGAWWNERLHASCAPPALPSLCCAKRGANAAAEAFPTRAGHFVPCASHAYHLLRFELSKKRLSEKIFCMTACI